MSMDGTSNSCSRAPLSLHPFSPRGLSPFWPQLGTGTFTKGPFAPPKNFGYRSEYHIGSPRVSKLRASLMRVGIGSAPYGLGGSVLNSIGYVFRRVQQQNSYKYEDSFALEAEILEFMNQSDRPELFPSQSELMKAGRSDLVEKILARGGWMVAGWDVEPCIENQAQNFENIAIANSNIEHFTKVSSELTDNFKNRQLAKEGSVFSTEKIEAGHSHYAIPALERQKGWKKVANLFGLSVTPKPEYDCSPAALVNEEFSKADSKFLNQPSLQFQQDDMLERRKNTVSQVLSGGEGFSLAMVEKKKKKKKVPHKPVTTSTMVLNDEHASPAVCKDTQIKDGKNKYLNAYEIQSDKTSKMTVTHRIRGLEDELTMILNVLKSGRRTLMENMKSKQKVLEIEEVSDALEFCETEIMKKKRELRTARAQQTAFEGKLALNLMEHQKSMEEKENRLEEAMHVLRTLRTVRIVWPNPASEVFLAGSFDGWSSWKRMEKCSAGVFSTTLQLYPGEYEIKFVVDGTWRVDANRPKTFASGHENNVLAVL